MRITLLTLVVAVAVVALRSVGAYDPTTAAMIDLHKASAGLIKEMVGVDKRIQMERPKREVATREELMLRARHAARRRGAPDLFSMPVEGYIVWGRTHCNSTDNPQNYYTKSNHQSYSTVTWYVNNIRGGVLSGGKRYLINDVNYNDGADCSIMKILYQHMVDVDGAQFLFAPVNPDCSVLAKFAESRGILYGNGGDYSLLILRNTPNATTAYDTEPWTQAIGYDDLQWTFNGMNDITQGGASCAEALTNPSYIDQSRVPSGKPPAKVRTAVFGSNAAEVPYLAATQKYQLLIRNVTALANDTVWILNDIVQQQCNYLNPTLEEWKRLDPDFIYFITGASNGSIGFDCMHKLNYNPPAVMMPTALSLDQSDYPAWHTQGLVQELPYYASINFYDQIFGDYQTFYDTYQTLWGEQATFYELTFASTAVVLLTCIENTGTTTNVTVIRDCIRNFNQSTIYGQITFNPNGWFVDRPNVCLQKKGSGVYSVVFPADYPDAVKLLLPSDFSMNRTWLKQFDGPKGIKTTNLVLIIVFSIFGFGLGAAGLGYFVFTRYYEPMWFPKSSKTGAADW